jgi:GTP-binding protein
MIADLPGYGYAKVSKEAQNRWQKYLEEYLLERQQIKSLVQLVDGRHEIQKNDYQMREWIEAYNLPIFTIVTKMDYVSKSKTLNVLKYVEKEFGGTVLPFSAIDNRYNEKIFEYIFENL